MRPTMVCHLMLMTFVVSFCVGNAQLSTDFYANTCPNVESLVKEAVTKKFQQTFVTVPATLRMFFHDCFVEGCDSSVMISSTDDNKAEKDDEKNLSLAGDGFDTVTKAKEAVEQACPGTVSCADILALATRDVIVLSEGPSYTVELGRRDGLVSMASNVGANLPDPDFDVDELTSLFALKGLSQIDMIALSGAHTLGFSHCTVFANRLYNFSSSSTVDPSLNSTYVQQLMQLCPADVDPTIAIDMDPTTPRTFDNVYYKNLQSGKGLFTSDQILFLDSRTKDAIDTFANNPAAYQAAFITAMTNLGRVGVKTGRQGNIRKDCSLFNS